MDGIPTPADVERELGELRARAYGPGSDIRDDPAALARLTELEAARADAIRSAAKVDEPVIADDPSPDERAEDACCRSAAAADGPRAADNVA